MSQLTAPVQTPVNPDRGRLDRMRQSMERDEKVDALADLLSIAGNPVRLRILLYLTEVQRLCVTDLAALLGMSIQAVSAHLIKMKLQGVLVSRRCARTVYYSIADPEIGHGFRDMREAMMW